jgi:hypothetical protein
MEHGQDSANSLYQKWKEPGKIVAVKLKALYLDAGIWGESGDRWSKQGKNRCKWYRYTCFVQYLFYAIIASMPT